MDIHQIGRLVRRQRRQHQLRQAEVAALANVGNRFVSELENGKPGLEVGKVLDVMRVVGLSLQVEPATTDSIVLSNEY